VQYGQKMVRLAVLLIGIVNCAYAQDNSTSDKNNLQTSSINGMQLIIMDGPYQYKSGGVRLLGYIMELNTPLQAAENVQFIVCNTSTLINVKYSELKHVGTKCPNRLPPQWPETAALWTEWKVDSGKLVATNNIDWSKLNKRNSSGQELTSKDIPLGELPKKYQELITSERTDKTVAITFAAKNGSPLLGIVGKSSM
jgi:hypothetical protein